MVVAINPDIVDGPDLRRTKNLRITVGGKFDNSNDFKVYPGNLRRSLPSFICDTNNTTTKNITGFARVGIVLSAMTPANLDLLSKWMRYIAETSYLTVLLFIQSGTVGESTDPETVSATFRSLATVFSRCVYLELKLTSAHAALLAGLEAASFATLECLELCPLPDDGLRDGEFLMPDRCLATWSGADPSEVVPDESTSMEVDDHDGDQGWNDLLRTGFTDTPVLDRIHANLKWIARSQLPLQQVTMLVGPSGEQSEDCIPVWLEMLSRFPLVEICGIRLTGCSQTCDHATPPAAEVVLPSVKKLHVLDPFIYQEGYNPKDNHASFWDHLTVPNVRKMHISASDCVSVARMIQRSGCTELRSLMIFNCTADDVDAVKALLQHTPNLTSFTLEPSPVLVGPSVDPTIIRGRSRIPRQEPKLAEIFVTAARIDCLVKVRLAILPLGMLFRRFDEKAFRAAVSQKLKEEGNEGTRPDLKHWDLEEEGCEVVLFFSDNE